MDEGEKKGIIPLTTHINPETHRRMRVVAMALGMTQQMAVEEAISDWIDAHQTDAMLVLQGDG